MKKKVLKIVLPISILLIGAITALCVILFQNKNPYELKTENFEATIEFNGDVDLNTLSIYNSKTKETISANNFTVVSCSATDTIGEKILVIEYNGRQFTIPFKVKYKVEFYLDEQVISSQFVTTAEEIVIPENIVKTGYEFISWDKAIPESLNTNLTLNAIMSSTTLTVPSLQAISTVYGTELSSIILPSNSNGRWEFINTTTNHVGDVGTHTFEVKFIPNTNELVERYSTVDLIVEQKELTFNILQDEFIYNGLQQFPIYSLPVSGLNVTELGHATNASNNAYDYSIVINETNYYGYILGSFKINKANVNIEICADTDIDNTAQNQQVNYTQEFNINYTITGFENEQLLDLTFDNHLNLNAGTHYIGASSNNPNINLIVDKAVIEVLPINLNPAPANPTLSTAEVPAVYGDKLSTITFKDNFANGKWDWINSNEIINKVNGFTATAKFTPYSNNYKSETREISVENISKKTLSIKVTDNQFIYNGEPKTIAYSIEDGAFNHLNVEGIVQATNAGTYTTTISIKDEFYQGSVDTSLVIAKATPVTDFTTTFSKTWFTGIKLSNIALNTGYKWNTPSTSIDIGTQIYSATYTPEDIDNYNSVEGNFEVTVNKANASIANVLNNYTFTYTGNAHTISGVQPLHTEEELTYAYSKNGSSIENLTNAGTYDVTITLPESAHYFKAQATTTVVIEKADLNVQLASLTATYEDTLNEVKLPIVNNGVWNWKEETSTSVGVAGEQKHVAVFTPNNENYNNVEFETTILVAPKILTIEITTNKFTYNGENHKLIYIIKDNKQKDYSSLEIIGNNEQINASTYDLTLSVKNPNYKATKSAQLIINKASPVPTIPTNLTATYLDLVKDITLPILENGSWKWNTTNSTTVGNAGNNSFSATFTFNEKEGCDNYIDYTTNLSIKVGKKDVVVPSLTTESATYTGSTISAQIQNPELGLYSVTENGWTNVDDYNVILTLNNPSNYKWQTSDQATINIPFSITKATTVISNVTIKNWTYNGIAEVPADSAPTATKNFGTISFVYSNEENGTYSSTVPTDAGSYYIKAVITGTTNYSSAESAPTNFNIAKAYLKNPTVKSKPYTGVKLTADVTPSDLYTIVNEGGTEKGSYDVIFTITNNNYQWGNNSNVLKLTFEITSVSNSWSVDKITMPDWKFGETPKLETITATYSKVTVQYKLKTQSDEHYSSTLPTNAGEYVAKFYASGSESYNSLTEYAYFTITKLGINIPNAINTPYTGNEITAEFDDSDLYAIDTANSTLKATNVSKNTVTFVITSPNHKWEIGNETTATVEFNIIKATTVISNVTIKNWTYNGIAEVPADSTPTATKNFGTISYQYSNVIDGTYSTTVPTDVGSYYVKAVIEGTTNYSSAESEPKLFKITQASTVVSNVTIDGWTFGDATINTPTATSNFGTISYQYSATINGTYSTTVPTNAGTYYVKAIVSGTNNFSSAESEEPTSFTISKLGIGIPSIPEQTYTGSELTADIGAASTIYAVDTTNSTLKATNADNYTITFVITNTNYKWNIGDEITATTIFKIKKATPVISGLQIQNVNYGSALNPSASSTFGLPVVFKYSTEEDGTYSLTIPTNVGSYFVKATVAETANCNDAESNPLSFSILKANASISSLSIPSWTYLKDSASNYSITKSNFVESIDIVVEYLVNGNWSATKPSVPGTYLIRAKINGTPNYDGCDYFSGNEFIISVPEIAITNPVHNTIYMNIDDVSSASTQTSAPSAKIKNTTINVAGTWSYGSLNYVHGTNTSSYTLTFTPNDTYLLKQDGYSSTVSLTVASVAKIGTTQFATIESALDKSVSGDVIIVMAQTTGKVKIQSETAIIKNGVTLVLPYDENDGRNTEGTSNNDFSSDSMKKANEDSLPYLCLKNKVIMAPNSKLTIREGGILEIAGELSGANGGADFAGHTARYYAELVMEAGAEIISEGVIKLTGFISESTYNNGSIITANKGSISLPFVLKDFRGGSYMSATYLTGKSNQTAPFNQYQFRNISSKLKVNYNAKIYGYANLYANYSRNHTSISFVGSGSDFMIMFTNENSYMLAHYDPSKEVCKLDFYNGFTLNALKMNIAGTRVSTSDVYFPVNCYFNISLNADENKTANYTLTQKIKLLPGAVLTINKGVTATFGNVNIYDRTYTDETNVGRKYPKLNVDAVINVEGTMICDSLGGNIKSQTIGASVQISTNNQLTTYETKGAVTSSGFLGLTKKIDFKPVTYTATFNGVTATTKGTYTYNGSSWTVS